MVNEDRWKALTDKFHVLMKEMLDLAVEEYGATGDISLAKHQIQIKGMTAVPTEWVTLPPEIEAVAPGTKAPFAFMPWDPIYMAQHIIMEQRHVATVDGALVPGPAVILIAGIQTQDE